MIKTINAIPNENYLKLIYLHSNLDINSIKKIVLFI